MPLLSKWLYISLYITHRVIFKPISTGTRPSVPGLLLTLQLQLMSLSHSFSNNTDLILIPHIHHELYLYSR